MCEDSHALLTGVSLDAQNPASRSASYIKPVSDVVAAQEVYGSIMTNCVRMSSQVPKCLGRLRCTILPFLLTSITTEAVPDY
eukprot:58240-Amphidinium_carterae.1